MKDETFLRTIEIERGLTEWAEDRAERARVPVEVVLRTATRYPVAYMHPERFPEPPPELDAPGGPLTLQQVIVAIVLTFAILAGYGGGDVGFNPDPATAKPAAHGSK